MDKKRTVEIVYFDAGGGHRSAMNALSGVLAETHPDWLIRPTNLQELLEPIDPIYKVTDKLSVIREVLDEVKPKIGSPLLQKFIESIAPTLTFHTLQSDQFYNELLKRGVRSGIDILLPIMQSLIGLYSGMIVSILKKHWQKPANRPDIVISVIPNFNKVMFRALRQTNPGVPYVTIMTDMVDLPPHFWMEKQDQVMICGTEKAYAQAVKSKFYQRQNIHLVSGMILKKCFYETAKNEPVSLASLGLSTSRHIKTALVMFGGNGSALSRQIVEQLNASGLDIQTIVMCGNNRELYESLKNIDRCTPVPFKTDITPYLRLADFLIGKPGPGSISEAVHMGRPVLVEGNSVTLPQERPNIDWILQNGVGAAVNSLANEVAEAAALMIDNLDIYRGNIAKLKANRAVFEIAGILDRVMENPVAYVNENTPPLTLKKLRLKARVIAATSVRKKTWKKILKRAR